MVLYITYTYLNHFLQQWHKCFLLLSLLFARYKYADIVSNLMFRGFRRYGLRRNKTYLRIYITASVRSWARDLATVETKI